MAGGRVGASSNQKRGATGKKTAGYAKGGQSRSRPSADLPEKNPHSDNVRLRPGRSLGRVPDLAAPADSEMRALKSVTERAVRLGVCS